MSPRKRVKVDAAASPDPGGGDRISALPDDALHHVLSFLPAEDAVRTCVLARRWRHLWKSATGLRIGFSHGDILPSLDSLRHFVNHLLLLGERDSCLHTCELRLRPRYVTRWLAEERISQNLWIRHVLIAESYFYQVPQISSKSLKHLSISNSCFDQWGVHTLIYAPSLVSLRLHAHFFSVPVLCSMPSLKEAFVRDHIWDCGFEECFSCNGAMPDESDYKNKCFLLKGLSESENLTLMCDYNGIVFHRDLKWCPTFNNLRTLLLNEWWCLDPDFYGLNLIFKHSPVLEKLNLHLFSKGPQHKVEMIGRYNQMETPATILKHLKEIEVKCYVVNKRIHKVLRFLGTFGIHK